MLESERRRIGLSCFARPILVSLMYEFGLQMVLQWLLLRLYGRLEDYTVYSARSFRCYPLFSCPVA